MEKTIIKSKTFGGFAGESPEEIAGIFGESWPEGAELLFAVYNMNDYDGNATVVYRVGDDIYEVNGSHCSCHGLSGQWYPEKTTIEAMLMRYWEPEEEQCLRDLLPA